jgi:hypothetical protein
MKTILSVVLSVLLASEAMAQVPVLNSNPSSQATIYLDFDGQYVTGTLWNWNGAINALPAALDSAKITEIFLRVSEDYRIFNVNITTDSIVFKNAPINRRIRVIVTPTISWYPSLVGGTSMVGSFAWWNDTPAWVFDSNLGYDPKNIAEACSHEAGHTLGLQHQSVYDGSCAKVTDYSPGQGTGEIGWAPIMGTGYSRNMTTWHTGPNAAGCAIIQNDINVIASTTNGFGLKTDDHSDTYASATDIPLTPIDFTAKGIINGLDDKDVFAFTLPNPTSVRLNAVPQNVGAGNAGANVDIRVALINNIGDTVGKYNPYDLLNAGLDSNLNSGTYYIVVEGVSNINMPDYGSVGSYSLIGLIANVLPIHQFRLSGSVSDGMHSLQWNFRADEPIKKLNVEISKDGTRFSTLTELSPEARSYSWKPADNSSVIHYRIKAITVADQRAYYSDIATLRPGNKGKAIEVQGTVVSSQIVVNSAQTCSYQLFDESGRMLQNGSLQAGTTRVGINGLAKGLLLLRINDGSETHTFKLIKQ